ncbi:hypothetical protein, partial [Burkholderia sp. SIMBA_024]|uniref:hypothetical protein n=1 Tax=Burkholderia sp. SIMBA_024 TaxID=3085768 RepID=UPI00397DE20D
MFLRWGITPAETAHYLLAAETRHGGGDGGTASAGQDGDTDNTEADQCNYDRGRVMKADLGMV